MTITVKSSLRKTHVLQIVFLWIQSSLCILPSTVEKYSVYVQHSSIQTLIQCFSQLSHDSNWDSLFFKWCFFFRELFPLLGIWLCWCTVAVLQCQERCAAATGRETLFLLIVWSAAVCPQEVGRLLSQRGALHARVTHEVVPLCAAVARGSPHPSCVWRLRCFALGESGHSASVGKLVPVELSLILFLFSKKKTWLKVSGTPASDQSCRACFTKHRLSVSVKMRLLCANTISAICWCLG